MILTKKKSVNYCNDYLLNTIFKTVVNTILLLATCFVYSQECNLVIQGKVLGLHDNQPLEAAVVQIKGTNQNTISSANGEFTLNQLCDRDITLVISHLNCDVKEQKVDVDASTKITIYMDHHIELLDEVIIQTENKNAPSATSQVYALSQSQKERYAGEGLGKAIEQISGVTTLSTGGGLSKPMIHGMFGSRVGIIYNQTVLENQQWGQDHAPNIDLNAFDNIQVVKGAATLQYTGDNPGGMILLESPTPLPYDSLYGKTILNGVSNNKGFSLISDLTQSFKNGTYLKAQGTYKNYGDAVAPNYVLTNTGIKESNLSITIGKNNYHDQWKLFFSIFNDEVGILRSSHVGSVRDLLQSIESSSPRVVRPFSHKIDAPKQSNRHLAANVQYKRTTSTNDVWGVKYSWQRNNRKEFDIRRGDNKNMPSIDIELNTHNVNADYEWKSGEASFKSGLFAQVQDNYSNPYTGVKRLIPDYIKFKTGGYLTAVVRPENLTIGFGVRFEHYNNEVQKFYKLSLWNRNNYESSLGKYVTKELSNKKLIRRRLFFNTVSLNTGLRFDVSKSQDIGLNYSLSQRAPDIAELFSDGLHHSLATIEYGNPFLDKETNHKLVFDYTKSSGDLQFNISPYVTLSKDFILIEPVGVELTVRGAFPVWEYKKVDATFKGLDVDLSYSPTESIRLHNVISWVEANNRNTNQPLINIPPLSINNSISFSPTRWQKFGFELNAKSVFEQQKYANYNFDVTVVEDGQYVTKKVDISTPPPTYNLIGADFRWGPYTFMSSKVNISLSIDNVFNKSYRNYLNRLRYYADEQGRNVLLQIKFNY